mgnify:CR=1 FL=1
MSIMSSRLIRHEVCKDDLEKAGANVIDIQGIMFYVNFEINDYKIAYIYHLKPDKTYTLERIKPYFVQIGTYDKEENVVNAIKIDIEQFKNAMKSSNFKDFIQVDDKISKLVRVFEDLYLYYNLGDKEINKLNKEIDTILDTIKDIMKKSDRVYYKKDPDVLKHDFSFKKKK